MENHEEKSEREKLIQKIIEERTRLIAELFSKPSKKRRKEIEERILQLDNQYRSLHE